MPNTLSSRPNLLSREGLLHPQELNQGDCVQLTTKEELFQVIGIDPEHKKCWVRQWPLLPNGSPVFEVSVGEVISLPDHSKQNQ
ncbi:hypothetical protein [Prochlorococcus sp. MIT 1300]|uniref:hypothetical protein n=1 Tax=Prochlorococcus sp. MIT 1300 TaxID=3096218 RepID=UPI002A75ED0B|nr:hypothetical protein [Prochlorococcus sp. MIT 1300]